MRFLLSTAIAMGALFTSAAFASEFDWEATVLNNATRESKTFSLNDKELSLGDLGGYKCTVKALEKVDGPTTFEEKRLLVCTMNGAAIGVEVSCEVKKKNNKSTSESEDLHLFNAKAEATHLVSVGCS